MTDRLYYKDSYKTAFNARVVERVPGETNFGLVLDKTYFYPTSGGQPFDRGKINGVEVQEVVIRESDQAVLHIVANEIQAKEVTAEIDWARRFDHMQQHSGQHILSQAFTRVAKAETIGFHLGEGSCTLDVDKADLTPEQIEQVEQLANRIIWEDRAVRAMQIARERAQALALRRVPTLDSDQLRLIEIEDFDLTACGGTHVASTGQIGVLKIVRFERRGQMLRLEFRCGNRALQDYAVKSEIVNQLSALLTTGHAELGEAVARLQGELKSVRRELKKSTRQLLTYEAEELVQRGTATGSMILVSQVFRDRDPTELQHLAHQITRHPGTIALLGATGSSTKIVFARSDDAVGAMDQLLIQTLKGLGSADGGGSAKFAQGGGVAVPIDRLALLVREAEKLLLGMSSTQDSA